MLPAGYLLFVFVLILKSLTKIKKMKKVLFVLALGAFAACGTGENKATTDTTTVAPETIPAPVTPDTTGVNADTTHADTTHH